MQHVEQSNGSPDGKPACYKKRKRSRSLVTTRLVISFFIYFIFFVKLLNFLLFSEYSESMFEEGNRGKGFL